MGRPKPLLPLLGKPVIAHCLEGILSAGVTDVVVVVRSDGHAIEEALGPYPVKVVKNPMPESEMSDSVRCGLVSLDGSSTGVMICLADQPLIMHATYRALIARHLDDPGRIWIPRYMGKKGHPPVVTQRTLGTLSDGLTLREAMSKELVSAGYLDLDDCGVTLDMDTEDDYRRICALAGDV